MDISIIIVIVVVLIVILFLFLKWFSGEKVAEPQKNNKPEVFNVDVNTIYDRFSNYLDFVDDSNIFDPIEIKRGEFFIVSNRNNHKRAINKLRSMIESDFWGRKYYIRRTGSQDALEMDDFLKNYFEEFKNADIDLK